MERIGKKTILAFLTAVCAVVGLSLALGTASVSAQEKSVRKAMCLFLMVAGQLSLLMKAMHI